MLFISPPQINNIITPDLQVSGKAAEYLANAANTRASVAYVREVRHIIRDVGVMSISAILTTMNPLIGAGVLAISVTSPVTINPPISYEMDLVHEVDEL